MCCFLFDWSSWMVQIRSCHEWYSDVMSCPPKKSTRNNHTDLTAAKRVEKVDRRWFQWRRLMQSVSRTLWSVWILLASILPYYAVPYHWWFSTPAHVNKWWRSWHMYIYMTFLMEPDSTNLREMFQPSTGELFWSSQISVWQVLCWLLELRSLGDGMWHPTFMFQ